jgi:type II secretory pathway component PulF
MIINYSHRVYLYEEMSKLLHSGFTTEKALQVLQEQELNRVQMQWVNAALKKCAKGYGIQNGEKISVIDLFDRLDQELVKSAEQTGKLALAFDFLSKYYQSFVKAKSDLRWGSAYPLILVHMGIMTPAFPNVMNPSQNPTIAEYTTSVFLKMIVLWIILGILWWSWKKINLLAEKNAWVDECLDKIPLYGKMRRHWALARYTLVFYFGLIAGISIPTLIEMSSHASFSARIIGSLNEILKQLKTGVSYAATLKKAGVYPRSFVNAIHTAESSGNLDKEMLTWHHAELVQAQTYCRRIVATMPKLALVIVGGYIAYKIYVFYSGIIDQSIEILNGF